MSSTVRTCRIEDAGGALDVLAADGAVVFPAVLEPTLIDDLRDGLDAAVTASTLVMERKGLSAAAAGIAHHLLPAHPVFPAFVETLPASEIVSTFLGGSFILNSFGGLLNRPATGGAYLHRWHRDLRAFAPTDDIRLMLNMLITLDPFTEANGGTLLDIGSHRVETREATDRRTALLTAPTGSVLLFDSRLLHAAGANASDQQRRALTLTFTPPYFKPQMDHVKQLGADRMASASETLKRRLGWYARVPESLDDWYNPPEHRFYREDR